MPELEVDLPATAVGKDYIGGSFISTAPSGSGFQFTLGGLFGVTAGPVEGIELNLLGLSFGANGSGIKLPLVGRVGFSAKPSAPSASTSAASPLGSASRDSSSALP